MWINQQFSAVLQNKFLMENSIFLMKVLIVWYIYYVTM